jgi:hypothetical protein
MGIDTDDETTPQRILNHIFAGGGIAIVHERESITGMLLAVMAPGLWDSSKIVMNEICLWVSPEHRGTAGYRLINEYTRQCEQMKKQGTIMNYTLSQMAGQKLDYTRWGFAPTETTWSQ